MSRIDELLASYEDRSIRQSETDELVRVLADHRASDIADAARMRELDALVAEQVTVERLLAEYDLAWRKPGSLDHPAGVAAVTRVIFAAQRTDSAVRAAVLGWRNTEGGMRTAIVANQRAAVEGLGADTATIKRDPVYRELALDRDMARAKVERLTTERATEKARADLAVSSLDACIAHRDAIEAELQRETDVCKRQDACAIAEDRQVGTYPYRMYCSECGLPRAAAVEPLPPFVPVDTTELVRLGNHGECGDLDGELRLVVLDLARRVNAAGLR